MIYDPYSFLIILPPLSPHSLIKTSHFPISPHITCTIIALSVTPSHTSIVAVVPFSLLGFCIYCSEDFELWASDEREHTVFVFRVTHCDLLFFHPLTRKLHGFTFPHSGIVSHSVYVPQVSYPFISRRFNYLYFWYIVSRAARAEQAFVQ